MPTRTDRCSARSTTGSSAKARTSSSTTASARMRSSTKARPACISRSGRRMRAGSPSVGDFNAWDGRRHAMRKRVGTGVWEIFVPALGEGTLYKYEIIGADGDAASAQGGSGRLRRRAPAVDARRSFATRRAFAWTDADWMAARARARSAPRADVHLRGAPGLVAPRRRQPLAHLRRARRRAGAVRRRDGLHASRADAGQRASAGRFVGIPADRPLRADEPLRRARGVRALRRPLPRRRAGRDPRLGARAFSGRPARPRAVRRHRALRARGSAPGLPSGLEHRDLQFRAEGGRQLS